MSAPRVLILMGSDSDWEVMSEAKKALDDLGVASEVHVSSAHRTPERTGKLAREAAGRGIQVIVCGAGAAAHLAGVCAAETELPVLGVPLAASDLKGLDALLATAQMPAGVPVGTLAGGRDAGLQRHVPADQAAARFAPTATCTQLAARAAVLPRRPELLLIGHLSGHGAVVADQGSARQRLMCPAPSAKRPASSENRISTRRFCWRPSAVSFVATG